MDTLSLYDLIVQNPGWSWVVIGLILLGLEITVPGGVLVWFGASALITGIATLALGLAWQTQYIIFILFSVISLLVWFRFFRVPSETSEDELLNNRGARYIGKSFEVVEPISNGRGKVKVDDSLWIVEGPDTSAGEFVTIKGLNGSILIAE